MQMPRLLPLLICSSLPLFAADPAPNWPAVDEESMRHFQTLVRMDTSDPPGNEVPAVEYLKRVLEAEGIEYKVLAVDPKRPNLIARLRGNGSKKPLLMMGHT